MNQRQKEKLEQNSVTAEQFRYRTQDIHSNFLSHVNREKEALRTEAERLEDLLSMVSDSDLKIALRNLNSKTWMKLYIAVIEVSNGG